MVDKIYYMYSRLACRYSDAFSCASDALAIKKVHNLLNRPDDPALINEWDLFCLGSFNVDDGRPQLLEVPRRVEFRQGLDVTKADSILEKEAKEWLNG